MHGEFACTSKACAPPPVGTGGSLPSSVGTVARAALNGDRSGMVARAYAALGFDARPRTVSSAELTHLVRQGKVRESWRGISRAEGEDVVPEDVARSYERSSRHPVVEGSYGSGTYVAFGKGGEREARDYAGSKGAVVRIGIPPKMGTFPVLREVTEVLDRMAQGGKGVSMFEKRNVAQGARLYKSLTDEGFSDGEIRTLASDSAVVGMMLGWDGVYVSAGDTVGYALVWNRGATVVDRDVSLTASVRVGFVDGGLVFACTEHGEFACSSKACAPPPVGTGGSLPSGSTKSADSTKKAFKLSEPLLPGMANPIFRARELMERGFSKEALEKAVQEWSEFWPDKPSVRTRVSVDVLNKILDDDGVIKTQHETGESKGWLDPKLRDLAEFVMFGVRYTRPKYGYIAEWGDRILTEWGTMTQYGNIVLEFKPDVLKRTTVTMDDSLLPVPYFGSPAPLLVADVKRSSPERLAAAHRQAVVSHYTEEALYDAPEYVEAQIHGDLNLRDVERIYVSDDPEQGGVDDSEIERIRSRFKSLGFDIEIVVYDEIEGFSVCALHEEFACKSKACAPPPVGTGGSLPSGSNERWTGGEATVPVVPKTPLRITAENTQVKWPNNLDDILDVIGPDREPYPEGFKVSELQAKALTQIGTGWAIGGSDTVPTLRKFARQAIEDGVDLVANGDGPRGDYREFRTNVARVLTVIRSAPVSTVWRGLQVSEEVLEQFKVGGTYSEVLATGTGRRPLAESFARGKFKSGEARSGTRKVLLKITGRNVPIVEQTEHVHLVSLSDERFISGDFRITSIEEGEMTIIEVEQIDG
jgi:hypothetical protein